MQALLVLRGSFPVHFLTLDTTGALAAYPLAAWFALVRASSTPGSSAGNPTAYLVEGSADGAAWRRLDPRVWVGPLI